MARQYDGMSEQAIQLREELKREALKKQRIFKIIRIAAIALCSLISIIFIITTVMHASDINNKVAELNLQIADKQQIMTAKQEALAVEGANIEYVDPIISNSHEAGVAVADIQNKLTAFTSAMKKADTNIISDEHKETLLELQAYFPNQNEIISTWCEYGTWYYLSDFEYENETINTAWLCYADEAKTKLLMMATATYDAKKNDFNGLEIIKSAHHQELLMAERGVK